MNGYIVPISYKTNGGRNMRPYYKLINGGRNMRPYYKLINGGRTYMWLT